MLGVCGALAGALAAGCGESRHQDAGEPKGHYTVQVTHASFPADQAVARPAQMVLDVRNTSARTLPDVTVAVTSFDYLSDYPNLASRRRPVWVVDQGPGQIAKPPVETVQVDPPGSGTTANYNVWALGPAGAGSDAQLRVERVAREAGGAQGLLPGVRRPQRQGAGAARRRLAHRRVASR